MINIIPILMLILILFFIIIIGIALHIVKSTLYPNAQSYTGTYEKEIKRGHFTADYYKQLKTEEIKIPSQYGYDIHGLYSPHGDEKKIIVLVHGYTFTLFGSVKYIPLFHKLGFSVFMYDQRYHGQSGGQNSTFGYYEKDDLTTVISHLKERFGDDAVIGTHGESLGGATVLQHCSIDERIDFAISDCAFMDMSTQIAYRMKVENKLPSFPLIQIASLFTKLKAGFYYRQASPINIASNITVPTMIIHGKADDYTPYQQGESLYQMLTCKKRFYGAVGAGHAKALAVDSKQYYHEVREFLISCDLIKS